MTLGFHHYANSFVGGVLLYALLENDRIWFPRNAAWVAGLAPLAFVLAYPFLFFALFRRDPSMAAMAEPGAWQSYYDAVFPFAPLVVAGVVYGLLHPSQSLLSRAMRIPFLRRTGELSFGIYLVHIPMIILMGSINGYGQWPFLAAIAATVVAAGVLSAFVEKPGIAFGRALGHWIVDRAIASEATESAIRARQARVGGRARSFSPGLERETVGSPRCCPGTDARSPSK
jgi:peptidoglycan/LPS O-acetylase OafA/YrhL